MQKITSEKILQFRNNSHTHARARAKNFDRHNKKLDFNELRFKLKT